MAYLHCHNCDWEQDDFWDLEYYNPIRCLRDEEQDLVFGSLEAPMDMDIGWKNECIDAGLLDESKRTATYLTKREVVIFHFRQAISRIEGMKYRTMEEYKKLNPERVCPKCGKQALDID